jgi:hypothetical protein
MPPARIASLSAILLALAVVSALAPTPAFAQGSVIKVVGSDKQPIPYAWIVVHGGVSAIANEHGELSLGSVRHKTLTLDVHRIGYQSWTGKIVLPDSGSTQIVTLPSLAEPLTEPTAGSPAATSTLVSEGFYQRWLQKQQGDFRDATYIGPEMVDARHAALTTDLIDRALGVTFHRDSKGVLAVMGTGVRPGSSTQVMGAPSGFGKAGGGNGGGGGRGSGGGGSRDASRSSADNPVARDACFMNVLIDGGPVCANVGCHYVFPNDPPGSSLDDHSIDINKAVSPKDVAAIEVYPRLDGMPPSVKDLYNGCGQILIWTTSKK